MYGNNIDEDTDAFMNFELSSLTLNVRGVSHETFRKLSVPKKRTKKRRILIKIKSLIQISIVYVRSTKFEIRTERTCAEGRKVGGWRIKKKRGESEKERCAIARLENRRAKGRWVWGTPTHAAGLCTPLGQRHSHSRHPPQSRYVCTHSASILTSDLQSNLSIYIHLKCFTWNSNQCKFANLLLLSKNSFFQPNKKSKLFFTSLTSIQVKIFIFLYQLHIQIYVQASDMNFDMYIWKNHLFFMFWVSLICYLKNNKLEEIFEVRLNGWKNVVKNRNKNMFVGLG